ncbi:response regulator [Candidatus Gracilibacteria bacterium]|nr:response regulator [Candidatus Gracilibacteria bacterium]
MAKILLIEDDKFLQKVYTQQLQSQSGWTVVIADDGEIGLALAASELPNIILLDLIIPKKDGFTVLQELKANPQLANIPVIITSGLGQEADIKKGMDLGAVDYMSKSDSTMDIIVEKVQKNLPQQ